MSPVLLDQNSLRRAGLTLGMIILLVFISGYAVGYNRAASVPVVESNETVALALPGPVHANAAEFEQQIPETMEPGADIDVDVPDSAAAIDNPMLSPEGAAAELVGDADNHAIKHEQTQSEDMAATNQNSITPTNTPVQLASLTVTPDVVVSHNNEQPDVRTNIQTQITDTASRDDARYTIQVGMFSDLYYALSRKQELESLQLSAYIHEYKNKQDKTRFNVRFGYFNSKSSARAALSSFEQGMNGSGFITNMSHSETAAHDQPSL